jgi:hypothetical protein
MRGSAAAASRKPLSRARQFAISHSWISCRTNRVAGLLTARALSDGYERVTILERDEILAPRGAWIGTVAST